MTKTSILILPGIGNSGNGVGRPGGMRCLPARGVWSSGIGITPCVATGSPLQATARDSGRRAVLVAHSLACLQLAIWASSTRCQVRAALLVAAPGPEGGAFPREAIGLSPLPLQRFAVPGIVVSSRNDPCGSIDHARRCATAWGSRLTEISPAGQVEASSGLGDGSKGRALLAEFLSR